MLFHAITSGEMERAPCRRLQPSFYKTDGQVLGFTGVQGFRETFVANYNA